MGRQPIPVSTLHMDLHPLDSIVLPLSSEAPADGAGKAQCEDLTTPTLQSLESEDLVMLDIFHVLDQNKQNLYEERSQPSREAHQWWSGESDGPPSSPYSPAQSLALQQRIRSNAPSPSPTPSNLAAAKSQVQGSKAEASDGMDADLNVQPQTYFVGMVNVSKIDLDVLRNRSMLSSLSISNGVKPFNSECCPNTRGSMSPMAAETSSSVQGHAVDYSGVQETGPRKTVQQELMARAQQQILSQQSEAQALSQISMRLSALLATRLQEDWSLLFDSFKLAASLAEKMTLAVEKARAAESIIWSLVPRTTSTHETLALQQQAEDAQQLIQEMMANQRHVHRQQQYLGAMVPQSSTSPQRTLPAQSAAVYRPQVQRQNQIRVQYISQAQPVPLEGPIGQVQEALAHVYQATGHTQQACEKAVQTTGAQQEAQEIVAYRQAQPQHHLYNAQAQSRSQWQALQARYVSRPVAYPQQPQLQATASTPQRAVRPGQLFTAQLCVNDQCCLYSDTHSRRMTPQAHQGADPFLRGGSSGDKQIPKSTAREVNENFSEDVEPSSYTLDVIRASVPGMQSSNSLNNSEVATTGQQRGPGLINTSSLQASTTSTIRRRDSIIDRLGDSQLNNVVMRNGMDPHIMTREQKRELAQNDLNIWRQEQRGRLRATPNLTTQPSSSSVISRQNDGQNHDSVGGPMNTAARTLEKSLEQTRITSAGEKLKNSDAEMAESTRLARERYMRAKSQQQSLDAEMAGQLGLARERDKRKQAQLQAQVQALARLQQRGLFHQQISHRNALPSSPHQSYVGRTPYTSKVGPAGGYVVANQERSQTLYHDSAHVVFSRPSSLASASHALFAEIVDEVTREVLAPGPGRCGITGV